MTRFSDLIINTSIGFKVRLPCCLQCYGDPSIASVAPRNWLLCATLQSIEREQCGHIFRPSFASKADIWTAISQIIAHRIWKPWLYSWGTVYTKQIRNNRKYIDWKIVDDVKDAIEHINTYGSGHTDAIVTEDGRPHTKPTLFIAISFTIFSIYR